MGSTCVEAFFPSADAGERNNEFAARVAESQRRVFQIAYSVLNDRADAEEVVQEVFLQAFRKFATLRDRERFRGWVGRIAFRLAINFERTRHRQLARDTAWHGSRPDPVVDGSCSAEESLLMDRLRAEIERLPEKLRTVLLLCTIEDMDAGTVAQILDVPVGTVRSRLHLARKRLLEALNP